jgi:hypothetical protein
MPCRSQSEILRTPNLRVRIVIPLELRMRFYISFDIRVTLYMPCVISE